MYAQNIHAARRYRLRLKLHFFKMEIIEKMVAYETFQPPVAASPALAK